MSRFDLYNMNERIEELRSKVDLTYSLIEVLDRALFNIYEKSIENKELPAFIYPSYQIERMKNELEKLKHEIDTMRIDESMVIDENMFPASFVLFAYQIRDIELKSERVLSQYQALSLVLGQRVLDLEIFEDFRRPGNLQYGFMNLREVRQSLDALVYQLVKASLGSSWMKDKKFAPITVFGEKDYLIHPETFVINVPFHDCFRSRHWASLAHEVAHLFVYYYKCEIEDEDFTDCFERNTYVLGNILHSILFNGEAYEPTYEVLSQLMELICDIVACYICGPPPFLSLCTYDRFSSSEIDFGSGTCIGVSRRTHPPLFFRLLVMKETLEHVGLLDVDKGLSEYVSSSRDLAEYDIRFALQQNSIDSPPNLFEEYSRFAERISNDILDYLDNFREERKINCFGSSEFIRLLKSVENIEFEKLTPIEAMNLNWLRRRTMAFEETNQTTEEFWRERKSEIDVFKSMVVICHNYYRKVVFPETRRYLSEERHEC